jgi:hypothetical protein
LSLFETEFLRRFFKPLERVEKVNRTHKPNPLIPLQPQQIEVARDNEVRFAGKSTGKDVVIGSGHNAARGDRGGISGSSEHDDRPLTLYELRPHPKLS